MNDLDKLNRLRVNAGKPELKSWKASAAKLNAAINDLEKAGHTDTVPGANVEAKPVTDDPQIAKNLPKADDEKSFEELAAERMPEVLKEPEVKKAKAQLGRGLETEPMARQSRIAVQMEKEREKREAKEQKAEAKAEEKEQKKAEKINGKKVKLAKGEVDPKKEPDKAARQKKHIEDKKAARAAKADKPAKPEKNSNEITVAEICRKLDIDPKVGRAKLRRHEDKLEKLHSKGQDRWTFPKTAEAEITKILR